MNLTQQKLALPTSLNVAPATFIAPFNAFNANTLLAARFPIFIFVELTLEGQIISVYLVLK